MIVSTTEKGVQNLQRVDAESGGVTPITRGPQEIVSFTASRGSGSAVVLVSSPTSIGDLEALDLTSGSRTPLTHVNEALFSTLTLTAPDDLWVNSFDGRKIQTWVQKPPDFDPTKKYPVILNIHGGPHAAYGYTFDHEFQWMAAKGYLVVYPNPRGSTSYGQEFGNIIQHRFPGDDAKDLNAAVDDGDQTRMGRSEAALRHRWQRRRHPDELDCDADGSLCGGGLAAFDRGLVRLLVRRRLHALPAALVHGSAVGGAEGVREPIADHVRRPREDADEVHRRRSRICAPRPRRAESRCIAR